MALQWLMRNPIVFSNEPFDLDFDNSYDDLAAQFDPLAHDRQARRKRKPKAKHTPKKAQDALINDIADAEGLEGGFKITYQPQLFEEGWLLESLRNFYDQALITDVLAKVRGGKEANVYRCEAHATTGGGLLAAKVYRPRMFRSIRDDSQYREGRETLDGQGRAVRARDWRLRKALEQRSTVGSAVESTSWLMYEYQALMTLHAAGANVPKPIGVSPNALLEGYVGDAGMAAPALSDVSLDADEAQPLLDVVLHNIELMLQHDLIHGDLSAYNILYWDGEVTLIDFPQVVALRGNRQAAGLLLRDIERVCAYFVAQGAHINTAATFERLWRRYAPYSQRDIEAEMSRSNETRLL
jgi:RIO kinase 1